MDDDLPFLSTRLFQLWRYTVSHSRLLLRSVKTEAAHSRIDLAFLNVDLVCLKATLNGVRIEEVHPSDISFPGLEIAVRGKAYRVTSGDFSGFVVAGAFAVAEDGREFFEPSMLLPEDDR